MRPWPKLAAETRADELGDDADVLFRQTEHLREHAPHVEDGLRLLVERQLDRRPTSRLFPAARWDCASRPA